MLTIERIRALVGRSNATILELGANGGENTKEFYDAFPHGRVFAFEPDPRCIGIIKSRQFDPRVTLFEMAVGATSGRTTFFQSSGSPPGPEHERWAQGWDQSGSIRRPTGHLVTHEWCKFDTNIDVEVTSLDDWAAKNAIDMIDFIWADVQGAEGDVIAGGLKTLQRTRYLYTEFSDEEMFEGDIGLSQIKALLPMFEVAEIFTTDVLLKNTAPICF